MRYSARRLKRARHRHATPVDSVVIAIYLVAATALMACGTTQPTSTPGPTVATSAVPPTDAPSILPTATAPPTVRPGTIVFRLRLAGAIATDDAFDVHVTGTNASPDLLTVCQPGGVPCASGKVYDVTLAGLTGTSIGYEFRRLAHYSSSVQIQSLMSGSANPATGAFIEYAYSSS